MEILVLDNKELKKYIKPPILNNQEKNYYFTIPNYLLDKAFSNYKIENIAIFIILWGYFRYSNRFYDIKFYKDKIFEYVQKKYNLPSFSKTISDRTIRHYKTQIKQYLKINPYTNEIKKILKQEALNLANNFIHRKKIFYTLVELSKKIQIEIPSYTELVKIIKTALNSQKQKIIEKLSYYQNDKRLKELNECLKKDTSYKNRYILLSYKKLNHSTSKKHIMGSLVKFETIQTKFHILEPIFQDIGIDNKIAEYYARWVEKSQVFQVKNKKNIESYFLLSAFVYYQYFIRNDNLIDIFINVVQSAKNSSYRAYKEFSFEIQPQKDNHIKSLEKNNISTLNEIEKIIKDTKLSAVKKVTIIEKIIANKTDSLKKILETKTSDTQLENKYNFIEKKSISLQGKLSNIIKVIKFDKKYSDKNLIEAIDYFKNNQTITNKAPNKFLDEEEKYMIFENGSFRVSLYKVLLFFHISDAIKQGKLNLVYSLKYRNFEDYLIDKEIWNKNKNQFLEKHQFNNLKYYDSFIQPIKQKLENSFKTTNQNINKGLNQYFLFNDKSFILKTPKVEKDNLEDNLSIYFPSNEYISIIDVLYSINEEVNFLGTFGHYNQSKSKISHNLLFAGILGYGCNLSIPKIAKISKGLNENQLENIKTWYFSEENTSLANDKIIEYMENLELVKIMRKQIDINHTSSDGQKYNISVDSTNAGYSFKYFGTNKGVVAYTFIDESHRLFHSQVINVNERESGYVIDGLLHNSTIKSDIHSTDTHGFSEVIFGLTNLLGFSFAPRIKNFKNQQLYGFYSPKYYHNLGYKLQPKRKINETIIKENWDDILRFIITIKERKSSTTQLLKRLNSYSKQHKLYSAIKEFGKIIKTDFLLNYIDDLELRQKIEKQLNKVESSNKFSKAVFFGNNSEFIVSTIEEQNIANNSKRLIQNAIILWNYLYLTKKFQNFKTQSEKDELIKILKNSSIVRWSHINLLGTYDFRNYSKRIHRLIAIDTKI